MKFLDLVRLVFENLGRRKARVALTAFGVVIGTSAVLVLVSLATGLQRNANEQLYGIGDLTQIQVYPTYGGYYYGPGPSGGGESPSDPVLITNQTLRDFAAIPGVMAVVPRDYFNGGLMLQYGRLEGYVGIIGIGTDNLSNLSLTATQGETLVGKNTVIIGSQVAASFYDPRIRPGQEPPPPPDLMGETIRVVLIRWNQDGTETRKTYQLRVAGVLTETRNEPDWSMYISLDELTKWNEWSMGRRINRDKDGYNQALVKVEDARQTVEVTDAIVALGYQAYSPQSFVEGINSFYLILQIIFGGVGAIALLVAAIGIANTMTMAILERTREIGLMKAIGATNRDVMSIFLGEAAGIGLLGGAGGVLFGWAAGQIINVLALAYLAGQSATNGGPPPSVAVYTPPWLPPFVVVFATIIGLLSGLYPALRAATMIPIQALKYE
ncbi:MAG: ABC transporter permease [Chloroflexi bacterium]|nr:ABC transporter permease [Chloroflexota bacterium]